MMGGRLMLSFERQLPNALSCSDIGAASPLIMQRDIGSTPWLSVATNSAHCWSTPPFHPEAIRTLVTVHSFSSLRY